MIKFRDIEFAFLFVSGDAPLMNQVYVDRETGQTYYVSEMGDSDELPDDIEDHRRYLRVPHKRDLDLGRRLVDDFVLERAPGLYEQVQDVFHRRGAYSRFKDLLDKKGLLEDWYKFEDDRSKAKLKAWCERVRLEVDFEPPA